MDKLTELKMLVEELNAASDAYYNGKETLMTDTEFDLKLKHLSELENELNIVMSNSPTINVGAPVLDKLEKVKHKYKPMLSLAKCHSAQEVLDFAKNQEVIAMIKYDGLSCRLTYQDGDLIKAETRGDGEIGSLITDHARQFKNIPLHINKNGTYVIDGEAIITDNDFAYINKSLPRGVEKYKNSRNLASGTLALLDMSIVNERKIKFMAWDVIVGDNSELLSKKLDNAKALGFEIGRYIRYSISTRHNKRALEKDTIIDALHDEIFNYAKDNGYPNDGIVWKFNDVAYGESLGNTSHHFNAGIAFKPAQEYFPTKLIDVEWTMGKTGSLCPTIVTEPVEIDGTIVTRASVHNCTIFKEFAFSKGCTCWLFKANQIIPQCYCVENNTDDLFEIPDVCPICGAATEIRKDNDTEVLYCTSDSCPGKILGKLKAFVSKQGMDIEGLSEATLKLLIDRKWVTSFKDLYNLNENQINLWKHHTVGFGEKSVQKLLDAIEESRKTTLDKFLAALSIPLIGKSTAKDIAAYCHGSIDEFIFIINNTSLEFMTIDKFGNTMLDSLLNWWDSNAEMVCELLEELEIIVPEENKEVSTGVNLNNATFCITGKLEHFANREAMIESITQHGGQYLSGVSSKLNYLVNNDKTSTSGKNKKALDIGTVQIISEADYLAMIGEN